jgi:hypothetical protein
MPVSVTQAGTVNRTPGPRRPGVATGITFTVTVTVTGSYMRGPARSGTGTVAVTVTVTRETCSVTVAGIMTRMIHDSVTRIMIIGLGLG